MTKALPLLLLLSVGAAAEDAPNIILIHADDLGWGDLSCYGQARFRTPHLDRLAAEGTRFTHYYAGSTVCAPSRYALLTGFHMGHAYIRGNGEIPLRPEDVTVAKLLKAKGYATSVVGKWGLGLPNNTGRPDLQGFDESFGYLDHKHAHRQYTDHLYRNGAKLDIDPQSWSGDLFEREALDFVARKKGGPFFLYLAFPNPHAELRAPKEAVDEFSFDEKPFVNEKADAHPSAGYRSQPKPRAAFAALVTRMDRSVGRLMAALKELGLDGKTLVLFTSDNGPHKEGGADPAFFRSSGPYRGLKRDLYEGGIRVPMIARWPGKVPAGRVSDFAWAHWDFLPTACALAGVEAPPGLDGLSVLPTLLGREQPGHEYLYWEFFERGFDQAVRWGDWKGVRNGLDGPLELYDLKSDEGEAADVAAKHPDVAAKLEALMKSARTPSERWVAKPKGKK
jgi:arylsulfatase A